MTTTAITTRAEAEQAIAQVAELIEKLHGLIEQETALVHAGKVRNAATLGPQKSDLTSKLYLTGESLKANAKFLLQAAPASATALGKVQEAYRAGDRTRGIGGDRAAAIRRPRAQGGAASLRRHGPRYGA
jgi:hypothetical protein